MRERLGNGFSVLKIQRDAALVYDETSYTFYHPTQVVVYMCLGFKIGSKKINTHK